MKIPTRLILLPALVLAAGTLSADWILIENFEDGDTSRWEGDSQLLQAGIHSEFQGQYEIVADPLGSNGTLVGLFSGGPAEGDNFGLPGAVAHSIDLPQPIERTGVATFYYKLGVGTFESDNAMGLTHTSEWNAFWGDMETVLRYEFTNATFDVYNQSRFETFGFPELTTWYQIWLVVDAANNTYDMYIQGGLDYPDQTRVMSFDGNETFIMRNRATDPIVRFGIIHNINSIEVPFPRDPVYLDNLYIDYSGMNLEVPSGGSIGPSDQWAGLTVDDDGNTDTGGLLGSIHVSLPDWVYVQGLDAWVYLPEDWYSADGSWCWIPGTPPLDGAGPWYDTGNWFGSLSEVSEDVYYSFTLEGWILIPQSGTDATGAWAFIPAP